MIDIMKKKLILFSVLVTYFILTWGLLRQEDNEDSSLNVISYAADDKTELNTTNSDQQLDIKSSLESGHRWNGNQSRSWEDTDDFSDRTYWNNGGEDEDTGQRLPIEHREVSNVDQQLTNENEFNNVQTKVGVEVGVQTAKPVNNGDATSSNVIDPFQFNSIVKPELEPVSFKSRNSHFDKTFLSYGQNLLRKGSSPSAPMVKPWKSYRNPNSGYQKYHVDTGDPPVTQSPIYEPEPVLDFPSFDDAIVNDQRSAHPSPPPLNHGHLPKSLGFNNATFSRQPWHAYSQYKVPKQDFTFGPNVNRYYDAPIFNFAPAQPVDFNVAKKRKTRKRFRVPSRRNPQFPPPEEVFQPSFPVDPEPVLDGLDEDGPLLNPPDGPPFILPEHLESFRSGAGNIPRLPPPFPPVPAAFPFLQRAPTLNQFQSPVAPFGVIRCRPNSLFSILTRRAVCYPSVLL